MSTDNETKTWIIRANHNKENPYFIMSRFLAQDKRLSFAARGVMTYLLSRHDNWKLQPSDLKQKCGSGKVYSLLNELIDAGYIVRWKAWNNETKRIDHYCYEVYEQSINDNPDLLSTNPQTALQQTALLQTGNRHITYKRVVHNTDKTKKDIADNQKAIIGAAALDENDNQDELGENTMDSNTPSLKIHLVHNPRFHGSPCLICNAVLDGDYDYYWYVNVLKRAICENCFDELDKLDRDGRAIITSPFAPTEPFNNCYYCHDGDGLCLNCRNKAIDNENHKKDEKSDNTKLEKTNTESQMPRWFMHIRDNDIKKHCDGCHTIISSKISYLLKGALNTIVLCPTCFDNVLDDNKPSTEIITKIIANSCQNNPVIGGCPLHEDDPLACLVCEWQNEVPETKLENDGSTPPCGLTSYDCQNINSAGRLEDQDICTRCNRRFVNTGFGKCKSCGRELSLDADGLCSECHFWNEYYPDTTYGKCNKCRQENTLKDGLCLKCQRNEMAIVINPQPKPTITIEELDSEILVPTEDEITEIEDTPIEMPETPEIEPQPEGDSVENRARGDLSDLGDKKVSIVTKSEKRALKAKSDNLTKPRKPTEHVLIVETLYKVFGWSLENIEYGGRIGKVAKWLRSHDVIASDIAGYVQWLKEFYKKQGYNNGEITIGSLNQVENLEKYRKYLSEQKPLITETIEDELGPNDPLKGIRVYGVDYEL